MNLLALARRIFGRNDPPSPPALRNKAGGMAWIKPYGELYGATAIAGQAVRTVRLVSEDQWEVEPRPSYVVGPFSVDCASSGVIGRPGDTAIVCALADHLLEPWKDTGITDEEVRDLFAPKQTEAA